MSRFTLPWFGPGRCSAKRAFTLVELLVVIGIIALLISILLPTLNKARQQGNLIYCESNLHNIGLAMTMYEGANNGYLPVGQIYYNNGNPPDTDWTLLLMPYLKKAKGADYTANESSQIYTDKDIVDPLSLPAGYSSSTIDCYACHRRLFGSMYNATDVAGTYKIVQIKSATDKILIMDNAQFMDDRWGTQILPETQFFWNPWYSYNDSLQAFTTAGLWRATPPAGLNVDYPSQWGNIIGSEVRFRHLGNKAANMLMADGHVDTFHYLGPGSDGNGNSDITWENLFPKP